MKQADELGPAQSHNLAVSQADASVPNHHSASLRYSLRYIVTAAAVGALYFFSAKLGLSLAVVDEQVSVVWPPTGIALAAIMVFGYRMWPAIWIGALLANILTDIPRLADAGIATGNTLEACLGVFLLKRVIAFRPAMDRLKDVFGLAILGAAIASAVSASIGTLSLLWEGALEQNGFAGAWWVWWLGDAMGALVVGPMLLTWSAEWPLRWNRWSATWAEIVAMFAGLGVVSYLAFDSPLLEIAQLKYMVFPLFIWSALRLGQPVTATAVFFVAAMAIWGATTSAGLNSSIDLNDRLILLQTFMGVVAVTSLALGAATAERARAQDAFRSSEQRLRVALRASRMGTWSNDLVRGRVDWSPELEEIFGMEPKSFSGREEEFFEMILPEDRDRVREVILNAMETKTEYEVEFRFTRADGQIRWMAGRGQAFYDGEGRPIRLAGIGMEITERKRAEEELARYRHRLEDLVGERTEALRQSLIQLRRSERLASLGTLAAGIAHEINNPLNSILLSADYAEHCKDDLDLEATLATIRNEAKRAGKIVQGVLKFARDEPTRKTAEDLNKVIIQVVELARSYLRVYSPEIELQLDPKLPLSAMNRTEMEQVILNLIKNAAEAAQVSIRVIIRTIADGGIRMEVEDNGPGIPDEAIPHIFDPFFTTHQRSGGTGLGLSICHGIINEHGGTITVRSEVGRGTTMIVVLPAVKTESPAC